MNKFQTLLLLLTMHTIAFATSVTFINDSLSNIMLTDHASYAFIIEPKTSHTFANKQPITFFIYVQDTSATYRLTYRIQEQTIQPEPVTMQYYDVASKKIDKLFPNRFIVTHQTRLQIEAEQQKRSQQIDQKRQSYSSEKHLSKQTPHSAHPYHQHASNNQKNITQQDGSYNNVPHQDVLNSLITEYNRIQAQKHNGLSDDLTKMLKTAHQRHTPYRSPNKKF